MQIHELRSKLNSSLDHFKTELSQVRTGRATTSLVEEIQVDAYGAKMKIKELGTITTPDPQMILISPWDKTLLPEIVKAVQLANLGLNPVPDSLTVKVPIPSLTEERRKEFTKIVTDKAEAAKHSIRNVRQDAMKDIDRAFSDKEITEDDKFSAKEEVEKIVHEVINQVEDLSEQKKEELMKV